MRSSSKCSAALSTSLFIAAVLLVFAVAPTFSQEAPPAAADTATQPSQQATEQVVRAHLWNECLTNPELQGAWVTKWRPYETDNDKTIGFQVTAIVDVAKADRQLELLRRRLAESGLTPTPRIEQSFRLPLSDLLTQVRKQLREKAGQAGCLVGGVVYGPDPSGVGGTDPDAILEVVPFGRTRSAEDTALILDAFREVVNTSAVWQKFVQDSQLQIVVVDRQLRESSYSETLCQDWEQVRQRIQSDSLLHYAWVELAECHDYAGKFAHYDLLVRVDSLASQVDESRIRKLVKGATDRPFGVIEVSQVPLAELLRQVNLTIESSPQLNGCDISGAEMVLKRMGGEVKYTLAFAGQVAEARQLPLMSSAVNRLMTPHAFWGKQLERVDFVTLFDQLKEVPTSTYAGKQYYGQALTEYRKGNFVDATALFGRAVTATPANLAWRYWRVVALLQQGDEAAALDHMRSIVARGESHRARSEIATALERVQGSVRQQLIKLEDQAMTTPAR